jgi:hypothetical protein
MKSLYIFIMLQYLLSPLILSQSIFSEKIDKKDTVERRIKTPPGFKRIAVTHNSFAGWLRNLPLKPAASAVLDYRGRIKKSAADTTVAAVVNMDIHGKNLDQCMDILMRLRTEYLISVKRQQEISFPLPDGTMLSWQAWKNGYRFRLKNYHFQIHKSASQDSSQRNFEIYLRTIFDYTGTQAFYHYYKTVPYDSLKIGDFIVKKNPHGHAVMIIDIAKDSSGNKIALFGQGDTPACQFYLLNFRKNNPWFPIRKTQKKPPLPIKKSMNWSGLRRF